MSAEIADPQAPAAGLKRPLILLLSPKPRAQWLRSLLLTEATPKTLLTLYMVEFVGLDEAVPPVAAAAGDPPPPAPVPNQAPPQQPNKSWDTFISELSLDPISLAVKIQQATAQTPWGDVVALFSRFIESINRDNYNPESALWNFGDSLATHYFLTVMDTKWQVVYGFKRCAPLHSNGGRLAGLRGDYRVVLGSIIQPQLFHKAQGMNTQSDLFQDTNVLVPDVPHILALLEADPTLELVDPPEEGLQISAWPMLPIHPKLASLFLSGPTLMQGFKAGLQALDYIPAEYPEEKRLFREHLLAGVTRVDGQGNTSCIDVAWTRVDVYSDQLLLEWYVSLLASVTSSSTNPPVGQTIATGRGGDLTFAFAPPLAGLTTAAGGGTPVVGGTTANAASTTEPVPAFGSGGEVPPLAPGNGLGDGGTPLAPDNGLGGGTPLAPDNGLGGGPGDPANGGGNPDLFRRVDTSSAMIELLQAMTDRLTAGSSNARSTTKHYDWAELEYLFERTGAPKINGSFTGLGEESLPDFLQALVSVRGEKANIRLFAERYRANHYPRDVMEHDFVWTTQLLKDIRNLSFAGEDGSAAYESRFQGLSVFSLAPISESNLAAGASMRQKMLQYEDTLANHGPSEASTLAKMAATWNGVPGARHEALSWVEHVWVMTKLILGNECPINQYLGRLQHNLQRPQLFHLWSGTDWKAFIWVLHIAYRAFMADKTTIPLSFLSMEMEARKRPDTRILPAKLQQASDGLALATSAQGDQSNRKRVAEGEVGANQATRKNGLSDLSPHLSLPYTKIGRRRS